MPGLVFVWSPSLISFNWGTFANHVSTIIKQLSLPYLGFFQPSKVPSFVIELIKSPYVKEEELFYFVLRCVIWYLVGHYCWFKWREKVKVGESLHNRKYKQSLEIYPLSSPICCFLSTHPILISFNTLTISIMKFRLRLLLLHCSPGEALSQRKLAKQNESLK